MIVLAELGVIIEHGRTKIPTITDLIDLLAKDHRFEIYPLTLDIFELSVSPKIAPVLELHDRLIAATALYLRNLGLDIALITQDVNLTDAEVVRVVW